MAYKNRQDQQGSGGTNILITNNTFTGQNIFLSPSPLLVENFEGVLYADNFAGGDIGAKVNAAYAALPSTGGTIRIGTGQYTQSTPIVFNTNLKPALLTGDGAGATTLNYTGGSNTAAITINTNGGVHPGYGVSGLKLNGSSATGSQVGVFLGGIGADDFKGASGCTLRDVYIQNFGVGVETGNHCFLITLDTCVINFCGVLIYENGAAGAGASIGTPGANTIDSGETMRVINCTLADAHNTLFGESLARYAINLQNSGSTDWSFTNTSFDDAELYINKSGGQSNTVHLTNCHFENPGNTDVGGSYTKYTFITMLPTQYTATLNLSNVQFVQDATTQAPNQFINAGSAVNAINVVVENNNASTVTNFVNFQDATSSNKCRWFAFNNLGNAITNMCSGFIPISGTGWADGTGAYSTISSSGTAIIRDFHGVLDATTFSGSDIGAQVNNAYASAVAGGSKSVIITIPKGSFSYSTPIAISTDGTRACIRGTPGDGTVLTFTGGSSTTAITFNCGYQGDGASSEHAHYVGLEGITLKGNNTSTTSPEIGVFLGGSNGAAGIIIDDCKIEGFGQGLVTGSNTYFYSVQNTVIRNCGQNVYIGGTDASATNSGEGVSFINCFIVDTASNAPADGFFIDNSGATSVTVIGCSFDDCQVHIQQAVNVTFIGTHFENPGYTAWGAYDYVIIDQNIASQVNMIGCIFWVDSTTASGKNPTNIISNGGNLMLSGCWIRTIVTSNITNFCVLTGSGILQWTNFNQVSGIITNIVSGIPYVSTGWTTSAGAFATITKGGTILSSKVYLAPTSTYSIKTTDEIVDCLTASFTVTLPTAVGFTGKPYTIINSGSGTVITINTTSAQTISGAASGALQLSTQYSAITVVSDGANWKQIA